MSVERTDLPTRAAAWALAGLLATLALAGLLVAGFLGYCGTLREPSPPRPAPRAAPMLQTSERADRTAIEARSGARLQAGVPIDEAMRRTAAAGWDATP